MSLLYSPLLEEVDFLRDIDRRGVHEPVLIIIEGAAGLVLGVRECYAKS